MADIASAVGPESSGGVPTESVKQRAPDGSASGADSESFNARFARMLINTPEALRGRPERQRGFLVVVQDTAQLQHVQALCLDPSFTTVLPVSALTARYRVRPGPVIGTILGAFAGDLQRMRSSDWDPKLAAGDLLPEPGPAPVQTPWARVVGLDSWERLFELASPTHLREATLGPQWMAGFLSALASPDALPVETRLVLFAEIDQVTDDASAWATAIEAILPLLPQRLGIVVSGAPTDLNHPRTIRADDPHLMIVAAGDVPTSAEPADSSYHYLDSALSGDQPADRDVLDVNRFADGLARLVLHMDTKPLTIGIHGPWGSGKSSFMGLVKQGLFRHAPANQENGLRHALDQIEERLDRYQPERWASQPAGEPVADYLVDAEYRRRQLLPRMEQAARKDVVAVDFNAWQYDSETQIWAGLASEITKALESAMPRYRRWTLPLRYAFGRSPSEVLFSLFVPVLAVVFVLALLSRVALSEAAGSQILGDLAAFSTALPGGLLIVIVLAWRTAVVAVPVSQRILKEARGPDYEARPGSRAR